MQYLLVDCQGQCLKLFVLKKAIQQGLKPLVVINKVDRPMQRAEEVYDEVLELCLSLNTWTKHLDFPFYMPQDDMVGFKEPVENSWTR